MSDKAIKVQATIAEIAVDLLGAERFVLLLRKEGSNECEVALARGLEQDPSGLYAREKYLGGDPLVDAALEDGVLRMGPEEFSDVIAAVPLRVQDAIVDILCQRLFQAARRRDVQAVYLAGGVAANGLLRERTADEAERRDELPRHCESGNREVIDGSLRLRAPQGILRDLEFAHAVVFDSVFS